MATKPKNDTPTVVPGKGVGTELNLIALSSEIGLQLAIPLIFFMIIGIRLDRAHHSAPLFTLVGIGLSMTVSVILVARLIARVSRSTAGRN